MSLLKVIFYTILLTISVAANSNMRGTISILSDGKLITSSCEGEECLSSDFWIDPTSLALETKGISVSNITLNSGDIKSVTCTFSEGIVNCVSTHIPAPPPPKKNISVVIDSARKDLSFLALNKGDNYMHVPAESLAPEATKRNVNYSRVEIIDGTYLHQINVVTKAQRAHIANYDYFPERYSAGSVIVNSSSKDLLFLDIPVKRLLPLKDALEASSGTDSKLRGECDKVVANGVVNGANRGNVDRACRNIAEIVKDKLYQRCTLDCEQIHVVALQDNSWKNTLILPNFCQEKCEPGPLLSYARTEKNYSLATEWCRVLENTEETLCAPWLDLVTRWRNGC